MLAIFNRFRDTTMPGRDHWQPASHRLQHRVRHTFLVAVLGGVTRMHENMRPLEKRPEPRLIQEAGQGYRAIDLQLLNLVVDRCIKRSIASYGQVGRREFLPKETKRLQS